MQDEPLQIMQAVQAMWQQGLGIDVTVETQEFGVYLSTIDSSTPLEERPHAFRLIWCADYPDENNWAHENFNTDVGWNPMSWEADANVPLGPNGMSFNQFYQRSAVCAGPGDAQMELYKAAEKILVDDAAAIAPINYFGQHRADQALSDAHLSQHRRGGVAAMGDRLGCQAAGRQFTPYSVLTVAYTQPISLRG